MCYRYPCRSMGVPAPSCPNAGCDGSNNNWHLMSALPVVGTFQRCSSWARSMLPTLPRIASYERRLGGALLAPERACRCIANPAAGVSRWWLPALVVVLMFAGVCSDEDGPEESKSSNILEVMAWCKGVNEGLDWNLMIRIAKTGCHENEDDDGLLRVRCEDEALGHIVSAAHMIIEASAVQIFACANGVAFIMAVSLVYARDQFSMRSATRAQALLWWALQENFMMDASIWPVKTFDVLEMFDHLPATLPLPPLELDPSALLDAVTIVVPRCPTTLANAIKRAFPQMQVIIGFEDEHMTGIPSHWSAFSDAFGRPTGNVLNQMLTQVNTPLTLVVVGAALPRGPEDIERMVRVLAKRRVAAVGGPLVDAERVYSDFCHQIRLRHYRLGFHSVYEHSVIFDEDSAASIRGSWFREEALDDKEGPCKLCDTLPPTFLARTEAVYGVGFNPMLDSEWALLDFSLRASRAPLIEVRGKDGAQAAAPQGRRHGKMQLALCPFVSVREVPDLGGPHLYGRHDLPSSGISPAEPWFGDDASALGGTAGSADERILRPSEQFKIFMDVNHLREFEGADGVTRHTGCSLSTVNCPVPNWVYRGWAAPPCCKETMRHLLFYIADVFTELGIRYIITDGVLLGSYKFASMLDWDADVDLHIHDDDFPRLESEVQSRVAEDGHFLRKHVNNNSWLLQANDHNYLLIELNKRSEPWDPDKVWHLPVEGRLFPAMEEAHLNLSSWYGLSFFRHRLRHVPEWEESSRPMYCATPYHYNCVDASQVPSGDDCQHVGVCCFFCEAYEV